MFYAFITDSRKLGLHFLLFYPVSILEISFMIGIAWNKSLKE